jgi:hypothetical protein
VFTWTPAGDPAARVKVTINSTTQGGHGNPLKAIIECDVPDADGQIIIPSAMVDAFPSSEGLAICVAIDCPLSQIMRYTRGVAAVPGGEVSLIVGSRMDFGVIHHP